MAFPPWHHPAPHRAYPSTFTPSTVHTWKSNGRWTGRGRAASSTKPRSGWDQELRLELRVEFELGPEAIDQGDRVAVDASDERLAGLDQVGHALVAEAARDLLAHPVPQPLDGVEVRAVAGQLDDRDAQPGRLRRDQLGDVAGGVVPDQHQPPFLARPPRHQRAQEQHGLLAVAPAVLPQPALAVAEVEGAVSVHPLL